MKQANVDANRRELSIPASALVLVSILILTNVSAGLQASLPEQSSLTTPDFSKMKVHSVLISIPDRKLALLRNGKAVRIYQVAVGKSSTPSPTGEFKIVNRVKNPIYYHKGQVIAAGKSNPVGSRWMGLSAKGYGIHGTNQPDSIGKAASTGCIRMSKRDLEELFAVLEVGDTVHIRADRDDQVAAVFASELGTEADAGYRGELWRRVMETMLQGLIIVGGLTFSLATSLLIEELIFGQIVRVAFARRAAKPKQFSEYEPKN